MPRALLRESAAGLECRCDMNAICTYLHKFLEGRVVRNFVNDAILSDGIVRNVFHVLITPVERSIEDRSCDTVDDGVLITLDCMKAIEQFAVLCMQCAKVMKGVQNEGRQAFAGDDGWFRRSQWLNIDLQSNPKSNRIYARRLLASLTTSMFSKSRTYCISPLISSKMMLRNLASESFLDLS